MVKKINFKENKEEVFVTFHYVHDIHGNYAPIAIRCKNYENAREVASDVNSLLDIQFLYINNSGFLREDTMFETSENYLNGKYSFQNIYQEYFNKYFKCKCNTSLSHKTIFNNCKHHG